jgi:hypothetical protein
MAKLKVNQKGYKKAQDLIKSHHYVLDSEWSEAQPSAERENDFLANHNWDDFGAWHLAIDPDTAEDSKEHYKFPYGDLQRVHRSGLIAAKQRAAQNDYTAIEEMADELLTMLDRK